MLPASPITSSLPSMRETGAAPQRPHTSRPASRTCRTPAGLACCCCSSPRREYRDRRPTAGSSPRPSNGSGRMASSSANRDLSRPVRDSEEWRTTRTYGGGRGTINLHRVRFCKDVAVSGETFWVYGSNRLVANVALSGKGTSPGRLHIVGTWVSAGRAFEAFVVHSPSEGGSSQSPSPRTNGSETLLRPPVPSDSALDAETLDVGATVEDARAPEPARLGSRELPLGADLWFTRC